MNVIKRDGSVVQYDRSKIVIALTKANDAVEEHEKATHEQIDAIADFISNKQKTRILVEDIQDMVEFKLMEIGKFALAKAYIIYRYNRAMVRKANTTDEPKAQPKTVTRRPTHGWQEADQTLSYYGTVSVGRRGHGSKRSCESEVALSQVEL